MIHTYTFSKKHTGIDRALSGWQSSGLTKHYNFDDMNDIPDLEKCDIAIFGNILPQYVAQINHPYKGYLFCSPFGQADLSSPEFPSAEISVLYHALHLRKQGRIQCLVTDNFELSVIHKCPYLPDSIDIKDESIYENLFNPNRTSYGLLGNNLRKHRNLHNQAVAISQLKEKLPVVINSNHPCYSFLSDFYGINFEVKNLNDEEYWNEISTHKISFQATHSETFNYMALEYALVGVPTVCCKDIGNWYPVKRAVVGNVDSVFDIAYTAESILTEGYWEMCEKLPGQAIKVNKLRQEIMHDNLMQLEKFK